MTVLGSKPMSKHYLPQHKLQPRRGDIFFADLTDAGNGSQRGSRPVIIIQNDVGNANSTSVIAAVITSANKKPLPTHVRLGMAHGLKRPSTAICEDIITLDKKMLLNFLGTVKNTEAEAALDRAIKISLGLDK